MNIGPTVLALMSEMRAAVNVYASCRQIFPQESKPRHHKPDRTCPPPKSKRLRRTALLPAACLLALGSFLAATEAMAHESQIPKAFQGAWSTQLKYCGNASDGNYFISSGFIEAWEVSWNIVQVSSKAKDVLSIQATHREYDDNSPVKLTIKRSGQNTINFQECDREYCWQVDLHRCAG